MNDRYLFKAKGQTDGKWHIGLLRTIGRGACTIYESVRFCWICDPSTLCQCTGLKDKAGNLIWENDILMCNNNPKDLAKAVFGQFSVIDVETLKEIDRVVGWHYEVIPTDEISRFEPFCLPMPLTNIYIDWCEMKVCGSVFDNLELSEE